MLPGVRGHDWNDLTDAAVAGTQLKMAKMKIGAHVAPRRADLFSSVGRVALLVICTVVFAVLGIAVPYKTYQYFKAKQDAAAASALYEEL